MVPTGTALAFLKSAKELIMADAAMVLMVVIGFAACLLVTQWMDRS
jgi:hypothetical protein